MLNCKYLACKCCIVFGVCCGRVGRVYRNLVDFGFFIVWDGLHTVGFNVIILGQGYLCVGVLGRGLGKEPRAGRPCPYGVLFAAVEM